MQSILNMSAPRSGKLYKEKAPRAECFFWLRGLDLNCTVLHFLCGENAAVSSAALTVRRTVIHYRLTLRVIRPRAHTPRSGKLYKKSTPCGMLFWLRGLDLNCTVLHFLCGENAAVSSAALTVRRTVIHYRLTLRVIRPRAHTPRSGELYKEKHPVRNAFFGS